ncbi:MAG: hypothetical protein RR386_03395 [Bacteroidaceae bacterium]
MRDRRLQNHIATSSFTLPVVAVLTTLVWILRDYTSIVHWLGLISTGVAAYIIVELNNTNTLIRIRSRLTSSTFICLMASATMLHAFTLDNLLVICVLLTYYLLFSSYQKAHAEGCIFHAFIFVGLGSLLLPQLLYFVPFYYLAMIIQLRSFTLRTFLASLLGILLPYVFYMSYLIYYSHLEEILIPFAKLTHVESIRLPTDPYQVPLLSFVGVLSLISIINFWRTKFNDKIRTRMLFYILIIQEFLIAALILLQPQSFKAIMPVLIMNSSPIIAHYFALSNTIICKIIFFLTLIGLILLTIYNIWMYSLIS